MRYSTAIALCAAALPLVSAGPIKRNSSYKNVVYWGANDSERSLASYCQSGQGIDFVILAFLDTFGAGQYPHGQIGSCTINADQSHSGCEQVAKDIDTCKNNGVKVFLSIGGADADNQWALSGTADAKGVAYSLWNSYANPAVTASGASRPFGNTFVNGWDIDLESRGKSGYGDSYKYLGDMINALRGYFPSDSSNKYYIGGAPQCPTPDANMGASINAAQYDYLWIQFYNNNCAANDLFQNSNNNPDGAGSFNLADWPGTIANGASKNAKLLVGLPGAHDAAASFDYVASKNLPSLISTAQKVANFHGIMIYDAGASDEVNVNGQNYAQLVKAALNNA